MNNVDYNYLKYLAVLLKHGSVSAAANELGITQPALSNALKKLRVIFGDELLVRSGPKMELTLFARELAPKLNRLGLLANEIVEQKMDFDPQTSSFRFDIAASDYAGLIVVPKLMKLLRSQYPKIEIHVHRLDVLEIKSGLAELKYNFVLGTGIRTDIPSGLFAKTIFQDRFAVAVRDDHPRVKRVITLEEYMAEEHIFVDPAGLNAKRVDLFLAQSGHRRKIVSTLPHVSVASFALVNSDELLTLPRRALELMSKSLPLSVMELPFEVPPFDITVIWHERTQNHPAHIWLRGIVSSLNY